MSTFPHFRWFTDGSGVDSRSEGATPLEGDRVACGEAGGMFQRILVPLDGSPLAETALPHAEAMGRKFGSRILLLRISHASEEKKAPAENPRMVYLEKLAADLREAGLEVECRVQSGDPSTCIIDLAESDAIDLVVMSSHGRTGLARWVYGSVAEKVLHNARCPMMLIRNNMETTNG